MVDAIPAVRLVWDLVVGLIRGYRAGRSDLFESHIEPLYQRMLRIHKDYVDGFEEAKRYLERNEVPPGEVVDFLQERRREYVAEREVAAMLAKELVRADRRVVSDEDWASVRQFCLAVVNYFSSSSYVAGISWYSYFIDKVEDRVSRGDSMPWARPAIAGDPQGDLLRSIRYTLDVELPHALSPINEYYAVLRTRLS